MWHRFGISFQALEMLGVILAKFMAPFVPGSPDFPGLTPKHVPSRYVINTHLTLVKALLAGVHFFPLEYLSCIKFYPFYIGQTRSKVPRVLIVYCYCVYLCVTGGGRER